MIIVAQNKEMIVNFDDVCVLGKSKQNPNVILSVTNNNNTQTLGKYATEERAKEVLQEIIRKYQDGERIFENAKGQWRCFKNIYEMPKE